MVLPRLTEKSIGMSKNSKENKELSSSFTVDSDISSVHEMPSITRLLNRKSFTKTIASPSSPSLAPEEPPSQTFISLDPPAPTTEGAGPSIASQPTRQRPQGALKPLHVWDPTTLRQGNDPLGKALASLLESGVTRALFLSIHPVAGRLSLFNASSAVNAGEKEAVWTGLCWDPTLLPGVWQQLISAGFVELPPPGTMTNLHSERNVSRAAIDVLPEEGLYLARVGTPQHCRGIIALISQKSLTAPLKQLLLMLSAAPPADAGKKSA